MNHLPCLQKPLVAALLALGAAAASAADFRIDGAITFSDLAGQTGLPFTGLFSLDLPAGDFTGSVELTAFSLSIGGQTYTLNGAALPATVDFTAGQFTALQYYWAGAGSASLNLVTGFSGGAFQGTLDVTDAQGNLSSGSFQVTAVPEPGTYALMLGGLGLVGWMARRRAAA